MSIAALEQATTFLSRTDLIATARQQPLPSGVTAILKISSGDGEALLAAQESTRHSQEDVRHAAEFYVQQILFAPDSNHYRVLGVDPDDAEAKIKLHYRLLVRWLHPDKNSSDWEVVFSERINRAWHALRTPERRLEYDAQLSSAGSITTNTGKSHEIKPAHWRDSKSDARFMSARTIQRLPVIVFSLLGVGALLALLLFSQMQPKLQQQSAMLPEDMPSPTSPTEALEQESTVAETKSKNKPKDKPSENKTNGFIASVVNAQPEEKQSKPLAVAAPAALIKQPLPAVLAKVSTGMVKMPKNAPPEKSAVLISPISLPMVASEDTAKSKRERKSKNTSLKPGNEKPPSSQAGILQAASASAANNQTDLASDASVKQFLQRFSKVYAEGDYFALHNLFSNDLSIISAPSQRSVLRSYRQLFESSQSREIALDHVTWLSSDEHIVVIASYQAQVLPRGKAQTQSSHGDIRLDLRLENGQLRIIRLQSDNKNG